jgi:hypothetical protein
MDTVIYCIYNDLVVWSVVRETYVAEYKRVPPTIPLIIRPIKIVPIQLVAEPRAYNTHPIIFTKQHTIRIDLYLYRLKKKLINGCAKAENIGVIPTSNPAMVLLPPKDVM